MNLDDADKHLTEHTLEKLMQFLKEEYATANAAIIITRDGFELTDEDGEIYYAGNDAKDAVVRLTEDQGK